MPDIYAVLNQLKISYEKFDHPAFFTIEDEQAYLKDHDPIPGFLTKNLFLRNRNGDRHYLIIMEGHKRLDIKALEHILNDSKLSFASADRLMRFLKLTPGCVGILALINDTEKAVQVKIDEELFEAEKFQTHPLINTSSLVIPTNAIATFLKYTGHTWDKIKLP